MSVLSKVHCKEALRKQGIMDLLYLFTDLNKTGRFSLWNFSKVTTRGIELGRHRHLKSGQAPGLVRYVMSGVYHVSVVCMYCISISNHFSLTIGLIIASFTN